jgi:hypothetical protein
VINRIGILRGAEAIARVAGLALAMASACASETLRAQPKPPELAFYGLESGRFEVAALRGTEGAELGALAGQAWAVWRGPFGLPDRWPVGITVRLAPAEGWPFGTDPWRVAAEPGGIVSVWLRARQPGEPEGLPERRRLLAALAAGAMHRQAVFIGVPPARITTPAWLGAAAAEAVLIRQQPALSDAWQRETASLARVPDLKRILTWRVDDDFDAENPRSAAYGVWSWLQADGRRTGAWRRFLAEVLGGGDPVTALTQHYQDLPGRDRPQELELAWQAACAQLVRINNVPVLEPSETRRWLEQLDRIVLSEGSDGAEKAFALVDLWDWRKEPAVRTPLADRSALLAANFRQVHPFYSNAAGSLGRAWSALAQDKIAAWRAARLEWTQDMAVGREMEAASKRLLDGLKTDSVPLSGSR